MFILAISAPFAITSHYVGMISDRFEKKNLVILGFFLVLIGVLIMTFFTDSRQIPMILIALMFFGVGAGATFGPSASLGISTIPRNYVGVATGALATVQEIGGTVGLSLVGAIIRTMEKSKLSFELNQEGVQLSPTTQDKIRSLLSSFEELQAYLSHMSSLMHAKILKAFSTSFMYGYRGAMWLLVAIAAFAILSIFFLTRNAKKVSQKD